MALLLEVGGLHLKILVNLMLWQIARMPRHRAQVVKPVRPREAG